MPENLFNSSHKSVSDQYRDNYDAIFRKNQCDGCKRGLAVENGIHFDDSGPFMVCTASRYKGGE